MRAPLLTAALELLRRLEDRPVVLAHQARVALGDEIAMALGCRHGRMLIGERPGLSAADSLGAYLTFGRRAAGGERRPQLHLQYQARRAGDPAGARKLAFLMDEARRLKLSGVGLKDDVPAELLEPQPVKPALENSAVQKKIMINLA